jgi:hypothetical protein
MLYPIFIYVYPETVRQQLLSGKGIWHFDAACVKVSPRSKKNKGGGLPPASFVEMFYGFSFIEIASTKLPNNICHIRHSR